MPDAYGVPQRDDPEDYQQFMLALHDLIAEAAIWRLDLTLSRRSLRHA